MVKRAVCLCGGKKVGIESIYTVQNGVQINIPGEVERLRELGRQGKLECPCGCGAKLILVAGDRGLREQHFRVKGASVCKVECCAHEESDLSICSKIIIKCWLDDILESKDIGASVPLADIQATSRRFEFTFYDYARKFGVCYWNKRENIDSDKMMAIDEFRDSLSVLFIADIHNAGSYIQYPEFTEKIQRTQRYTLYLDINIPEDSVVQAATYERALLHVRVNVQDENGWWKEVEVLTGKLSEFQISEDNKLLYMKSSIDNLVEQRTNEYYEQCKKIKVENEKRQQEIRQEAKCLNEERKKLETKKWQDEVECGLFPRKTERNEILQEVQSEPKGRCKYCSTPLYDYNVSCSWLNGESKGIGLCSDCNRKGRHSVKIKDSQVNVKKVSDATKMCAWCGGRMVERHGRNGVFWGCESYPRCRYTVKK